jgi:hypothetical protein
MYVVPSCITCAIVQVSLHVLKRSFLRVKQQWQLQPQSKFRLEVKKAASVAFFVALGYEYAQELDT